MEVLEVQLHTFLNSTPDHVWLSTSHLMEAVFVQLYTFLNSTPDNVQRSTEHRKKQ